MTATAYTILDFLSRNTPADHRSIFSRQSPNYSPEAMGEYEILEGLLTCLTAERKARRIASALITKFGSLQNIFGARLEALIENTECDLQTANRLKILGATAVGLAHRRLPERPITSSLETLITYLRCRFGQDPRRSHIAVYLDEDACLIRSEVLSIGTVGYVITDLRKIAQRSLDLNASSVVLATSRSGRSCDPTQAEIQMTCDLRDALDTLGVALQEHLIVSPYGHVAVSKPSPQ